MTLLVAFTRVYRSGAAYTAGDDRSGVNTVRFYTLPGGKDSTNRCPGGGGVPGARVVSCSREGVLVARIFTPYW